MITRGWLRAGIPILVLLANPFNADSRRWARATTGYRRPACRKCETRDQTPDHGARNSAAVFGRSRASAVFPRQSPSRRPADRTRNGRCECCTVAPQAFSERDRRCRKHKGSGAEGSRSSEYLTHDCVDRAAAPCCTPTPSAPEPILPKEAGGKLPEKAEPLPVMRRRLGQCPLGRRRT